MLIALDYDNTWTKTPVLWEGMVKTFKAANHRFVCVTSRAETEANKKELAGSIGKHMPVVFCNHQPKTETANQAGYKPDVWIDDRPETIPTQVEQWGVSFHLYKNGVFHSEHQDLKVAEKTAQFLMRMEQHVHAAIYLANAGGKGQPLHEMVRGQPINLLFGKAKR